MMARAFLDDQPLEIRANPRAIGDSVFSVRIPDIGWRKVRYAMSLGKIAQPYVLANGARIPIDLSI
jgi:hypothetical protein